MPLRVSFGGPVTGFSSQGTVPACGFDFITLEMSAASADAVHWNATCGIHTLTRRPLQVKHPLRDLVCLARILLRVLLSEWPSVAIGFAASSD